MVFFEPLAQTRESRLSPQKKRLRSEVIAALDQRITSIQLQQRFVSNKPGGSDDRNSEVLPQNRYGGVKPTN